MKEFVSAVVEAEAEETDDNAIEFKVDGRVVKAYPPHEGQLTLLMASMGRGQDKNTKFATIINLIMSCLREEDQEYLEGRLLDRDPKTRLRPEVIEDIFKFLVEEWFGRPTE